MTIRQIDGSAHRRASRKFSGAQEADITPNDRLELSSDQWVPLPRAPVSQADSPTPALQKSYGVILGCGIAGQVIGAAAGYWLTGSAWVGLAGYLGGGLLGTTVGALVAP